nr:MAG TPA: hypothetical protein [Caudoviricetes sp.]
MSISLVSLNLSIVYTYCRTLSTLFNKLFRDFFVTFCQILTNRSNSILARMLIFLLLYIADICSYYVRLDFKSPSLRHKK